MVYSDSYFRTRETWRDWRIEANQLLSLARVGAGQRILEIGCGGGGLLKLLSERGAEGIGVDTLVTALQFAKAREWPRGPRPSFVHLSEHQALPFQSASFDAVIGQHVVEHLDDVDAALCEWKRMLRPGGRLAIATPNSCYPDPAHFADSDHARIFAPGELRSAIERAGLIAESCFTVFPYLSHLRPLRALGVFAFRAFRHAPYFATRGRTILMSARLPG